MDKIVITGSERSLGKIVRLLKRMKGIEMTDGKGKPVKFVRPADAKVVNEVDEKAPDLSDEKITGLDKKESAPDQSAKQKSKSKK